jgi:hypothetical protein
MHMHAYRLDLVKILFVIFMVWKLSSLLHMQIYLRGYDVKFFLLKIEKKNCGAKFLKLYLIL